MRWKFNRRKQRMTKNQKLILGGVLSILFITVGYSVMQNVMRIRGYATIDVGDGMIFTRVDTKENNGATINSVPSIKAKTMINTSITFEETGSVTFTVAAQNQGEYDAQLIEIQKLNNLNGQTPQCIQTTVTNHSVGESVYPGVIKTFEVTVTSTCTERSSKEIEIYFKYKKQETQGGERPINENAVVYLKNNKVETDVSAGGNGLVEIDNTGEVTTSNTPREYRYIGSNPDNYVSFNNELWRIIGIFDGQLKIARASILDTKMAWASNSENDWSRASLQIYLNEEYLNGIDTTSQDYISDYTWKLGAAGDYRESSNGLVQHFYGYERGTEKYEYGTRPLEWTGKIALMYPSDYGFATSGGNTTNRSTCLSKELYIWDWNTLSDCKNNSWLYDSTNYQWTLTPSSAGQATGFQVINDGHVYYSYAVNMSLGIRPVLFLKSDVKISTGTGTERNPFILSAGI